MIENIVDRLLSLCIFTFSIPSPIFLLESVILDKKLIFSNTSFVMLDFFSNYQKELGDQIWFISQIQKGVVSSFVVVVKLLLL